MSKVGRYSIRHPEWLQVKKEGLFSYGYNQEWFTDSWKVIAGCGPTTGTQIISYIGFREGLLDVADAANGEAALARMNEVWDYITPRFGGGLYKTRWQAEGLDRYIQEHNLPYEVKMFSVHPLRACVGSFEEAKDFILQGLMADSPIAFLNRHKGSADDLSTWHWVPIISAEVTGNDVRCLVYDEGIEKRFSLSEWLSTNLLGGGFVYVERK